MLETVFLTSILMSFSADHKKNSYLAKLIPNKLDTIEELYIETPKSYIGNFSCINNVEKIESKLFQLFNLRQISPEVYNNSYDLIANFPEFILGRIDLDNIYTSQYGTLLIDFEFTNKNIFSLEIGKNSVGYFSEINSETHSFCESLKTKDTEGNTINSELISLEIENFLTKLNLI